MGSHRHLRRITVSSRHHHRSQPPTQRRELRQADQGHLRHHRRRRVHRRRRTIRELALRITALFLALAAITGALTACGGSSDTDTDKNSATIQTFTHSGIALPRTKEDGPRTTDPFPRGYAHTETGAALAAVNTSIVLDTASDDQWGAALAALVQNDDAYRQWALIRQQMTMKPRTASTATVTIAGWKVATYDDATAKVEVYSTYPDGSHAKLLRTVRWSGQDWKVVLPQDKSGAVVTAVNDFPEDMVTL